MGAQTIPLVTSLQCPTATQSMHWASKSHGDDGFNAAQPCHNDRFHTNSHCAGNSSASTRNAQTPSNQIILGLSLFLTLFIMSPVIDVVWMQALTPYLDGELNFKQPSLLLRALREFMFSQTRDTDLAMFAELGGYPIFASRDEVPLFVLLPSFLTSELKTAFQIGFLLFVPFLVIDLVVAAVLMSMGMMMLSPIIISLPFKLMLFVLIDGWSLISATLVSSFAL